MKLTLLVFQILVLLCATASPCAAQTIPTTPKAATPVDPIKAILDAFRSHQVVALGSGTEGNEQGHAFQLALIRDRRFARTVNDIVVEFGNARYQDVIDRFVRGDEISDDTLRQVWQNTTQPDMIWDAPIYEEFFRAVRKANASLPRRLQLRVWLGDPPIDWDIVHDVKTYGRWDRDRYPADLIGREILARERRALVIYGDLHFIRKNPRATGDQDNKAYSIVGLLEDPAKTRIFTIHTIASGMDLETLQPDVLKWRRPSLTILPGTVLGAASFSSFYPRPLVIGGNGKPAETPAQRRSLRMEEQFDALLYLGPQSTITKSEISPKLCADENYLKMRIGRMASLGLQSGVDRLKQYCKL